MSSQMAGIISFFIAILVVFVYPTSTINIEIVYASFHGVLVSLIIIYVLFFGIFLYHLMSQVGMIDTISTFVSNRTDDLARQVIILAIAFSPLIESVSGFGIGIIVVAPILVALGFGRFQAALISLMSLSAVPWGALATGIIIGSSLTDLTLQDIGIGSAYLSIPTFIYFAFVSIYVVKGKQGLIEKWLEVLVVSSALAAGVWISNYWLSVELAGVIGAIFALAIEGVFLYVTSKPNASIKKETGLIDRLTKMVNQNVSLIKILLPYFFLTLLLIISRTIPSIESTLSSIAVLKWERYSYTLPLLYSPGFFLLLTSIFMIILYKMPWEYIAKALRS